MAWDQALFRPDAVAPVNFFDCPLISDTIREAQVSALVSVRAEDGVILRSGPWEVAQLD